MKSFTLAFLFTILVVVAVGQKLKKCRREEDCGDTECCVDMGLFRGGSCKPLAKEGKPCSDTEDVSLLHGRYDRDCPCADGLDCVPEDERDLIIGKVKINQKCVAEGSFRNNTALAEETAAE